LHFSFLELKPFKIPFKPASQQALDFFFSKKRRKKEEKKKKKETRCQHHL